MKYWVYIDNQVLPQPYGAEELSSIPGFNEQTLICPEVVAEGEEQQWTAAGELIGYSQPVEEVPEMEAQPEYVEDYAPVAEEEAVYDASEEYNPAPLADNVEPVAYEEPVAQAAPVQPSVNESLLLEKMDFLVNELTSLKKDMAVLQEKASAMMHTQKLIQKNMARQPEKENKNTPIVKDAAALKAFQSEPLIPLDESAIPEEPLGPKASLTEGKPSDPIVLKASEPEEDSHDDILESAIENTMRMKMPVIQEGPVAFDLASKEKIQITSDEEPAKVETKEETADPAPATEEKPAVEETPAEIEEVEETVEEVESEVPVQISSVGSNEEEEILKTFAEEKKEAESKEEKVEEEYEALQKDMGIEETAEPAPAAEEIVAEEEVFTPEESAIDSVVEEEPLAFNPEESAAPALKIEAEEETPEQPVIEQPVETMPEPELTPIEEVAPAVQEEAETANPEEFEQQEVEAPQAVEEAPAEEPQDALAALTATAEGEQNAQLQTQDRVDDQFLKTFASSIEEIALDQPTSIISDYVPPTISTDSPLYSEDAATTPPAQEGMADLTSKNINNSVEDVRQVKRIKPAAIKTVPMVAAGDPIGADYNTPNIEEAIAELNTPSPLVKGIKSFALMVVLLFAVLGFVAALAGMGILPREMSPVHYVIDKVAGPGVEETLDLQETEEPTEEIAAEPEEDPQEEALNNIVTTVKNYTFVDGTTLEGRIKAANKNNADQIQWVADTSVEPGMYSVAVKLPPNKEGYSLTYRFSYNSTDGSLLATTSESNNIMASATM